MFLLLFFIFGIVGESIAIASPIGEWKFDDGSGRVTQDSSGKGKTGQLFGSTIKWVTGIRNKALQFFGTQDYVQVDPSIEDRTTWSFTAYVKPTDNQGTEQYVYSERDVNDDVYFYICITDDRRIKIGTRHHLRMGFDNQSEWEFYETDKNKILQDDWNHLVVTYVGGNFYWGDGSVKCYVNGRKVGEGNLGCSSKEPAINYKEAEVKWAGTTFTGLTKTGSSDGYPWTHMQQATINGQKMIFIPKFYYQHTVSGSAHTFKISGQPKGGYKLHPAFKNSEYICVGVDKFGEGKTLAQCRSSKPSNMQLLNIEAWSAIQMLQLIESTSTNGLGSDYRGLKNLYSSSSHTGQFVEGLKISSSNKYVVNGITTNLTVPALTGGTYGGGPHGKETLTHHGKDGYITNWHCDPQYDWLFLPSAVGGSSSTYIPCMIEEFGGQGEDLIVGVAGMSYCDCRIYCSSCRKQEHGSCTNGCSCNCGCSNGCRDGVHHYCYYHGDGICGRRCDVNAYGLFAMSFRAANTQSGSQVGSRLLYIP